MQFFSHLCDREMESAWPPPTSFVTVSSYSVLTDSSTLSSKREKPAAKSEKRILNTEQEQKCQLCAVGWSTHLDILETELASCSQALCPFMEVYSGKGFTSPTHCLVDIRTIVWDLLMGHEKMFCECQILTPTVKGLFWTPSTVCQTSPKRQRPY